MHRHAFWAAGAGVIVLVINHLFVDAVSWRTLIEDAATAWAQNSKQDGCLKDPVCRDRYNQALKLYDAAAPPSGVRRVAGRVNLNAASRVVLGSIPGLPAAAVGKIVSRREVEPDLNGTDQRHPVWLLIEGIVTIDEMRQLERYVTSGGDAFSGQAVGFFDAGPAAARQEFVVDRSGTTPHVRLQRDLSPLGRGFSTLSLGVESRDAP